ncbi:MAG: hypothetical protein COY66_03160 [Candidatus Kerfeldbacteria bacterium CG_4_10_14_0_8_um_filter_42_10]|uniref:Uncharacterized protein n=1 Tax=Candidatus Kerfeldbacteria bacterium CG_4_10_14_0_8_um_filter_42_10 TaxID=2014248 RepID=A0A2M7RJ20_9BACT|nr:MAG: hypothetical protein COY66_03160 [Candidatus Kerfeldbacteria bacterium CG_4_10_14_0_8_um_filter_42_10]
MSNLIVLFGFPGAGKTTLANAFIGQHAEYRHHDIYRYIEHYRKPDGSLIGEEFTIKAYQKMYQDLEAMTGSTLLELGTNHPGFNIQKLKELKTAWNVIIVFCILDKQECLKRTAQRERAFEEQALLRRFARNFPAEHQNLCQQLELNYYLLDMGQSVEQQVIYLETKIKK